MMELISIVIPMHNEAKNVEELVSEITETMHSSNYQYEVILVNDGSIDNTWQEIEVLVDHDRRIHGIDLAGHYGQTIALRAGFEASRGTMVVFMDGDLQHNPAELPRFFREMEKGRDMVGGMKTRSPEGFFQRTLSHIAHILIRKLSGVNMTYFGASYRCYRRYLLDGTPMIGDAHRFLGAMVANKGIRYSEIPIEIRGRKSGESNYTVAKIYPVVADLIFLKFFISYMSKPFRVFGLIGGLIVLAGIIPVVSLIFGPLFLEANIRLDYIAEFLFSVFLILLGLMFIGLGLIAEIGTHNYYAQRENTPYAIRKAFHRSNTNE